MRVIVKTWEKLLENSYVDKDGDLVFNDEVAFFRPQMKYLCGRIIEDFHDGVSIDNWVISEWMVEPVAGVDEPKLVGTYELHGKALPAIMEHVDFGDVEVFAVNGATNEAHFFYRVNNSILMAHASVNKIKRS